MVRRIIALPALPIIQSILWEAHARVVRFRTVWAAHRQMSVRIVVVVCPSVLIMLVSTVKLVAALNAVTLTSVLPAILCTVYQLTEHSAFNATYPIVCSAPVQAFVQNARQDILSMAMEQLRRAVMHVMWSVVQAVTLQLSVLPVLRVTLKFSTPVLHVKSQTVLHVG